jgi:hypothetical protein
VVHDIIDEASEGSIDGGLLAAAKDDGAMDVPGRQVLDGSTALILMFDADGLMWAGR